MPRRYRLQGCGSLSLALCLLFLQASAASAFPNDVLAKLSDLSKSTDIGDQHHRMKNVSSAAGASLPLLPSQDAAKVTAKSGKSPVSHAATGTSTGRKPVSETQELLPVHGGEASDDYPDYSSNGHDNFHSVPSASTDLYANYGQYRNGGLSSTFLVDESLSGHSETQGRGRNHALHDLWSETEANTGTAGERQDGEGGVEVDEGDSPEGRKREKGEREEVKKAKSDGEVEKKGTAANPCPQCQVRNEDRQHRIASMKRQILEKLHITSLPNRTSFPMPKALAHMPGIPDGALMQDAPYGMVDRFHDSYDDDNYTPPERVFTMAKPLPAPLEVHGKNTCFFSMAPVVYQAHIQKAFMWFYVRHAPAATQHDVVEMRLSRLGPPFSKKGRSLGKVVWSQKMHPDRAFGWKRVDVLSMVRRWVKHPSSNYGVDISALLGNDNLVILPPTSGTEQGYEPVLDIKLTADENRRHKRSDALKCSDNSTERRCCRYPLTVSFAEFGWDWVIAPTHVEADYCSGECRMTLQNQTPYSWIASQTQESGSCCTPSKMSALPLLYFDQNGNIVFQMLQNMKVERCGCA